jgi:hypothetical protein
MNKNNLSRANDPNILKLIAASYLYTMIAKHPPSVAKLESIGNSIYGKHIAGVAGTPITAVHHNHTTPIQ